MCIMNSIIALLLAVIPTCDHKPSLDPETHTHLKQFLHLAETKPSDEALLKALNDLSKRITDKHLDTVERFALLKTSKLVRWPLTRLLVERSQFDSAARIVVVALADVKKDRRYGMWKWWEVNFGERQDYKLFSRNITDSLLRQFEKGNDTTKSVVAEIFGKGKAEAKLTISEFKRVVGYKNK
jgi:hypothetical protein